MQRCDTGQTVNVCGTEIDNHFIISYSPYLLTHYQAHMNVKCTTRFNTINYIYKVGHMLIWGPSKSDALQYIYKGPDWATVAIDRNGGGPSCCCNEVQLYLDTHYISLIEVYACSMGWPMLISAERT